MRANSVDCLIAAGLLFALISAAEAAEPAISIAKKDADGFLVHTVQSPYQADEVKIRVLLPDKLVATRTYRVLYLLPVEALDENRYGDGLLEAKQRDLHNKHQLICIAPTFSHLPWYADHPTDRGIRQESHFIKIVVPFVEKTYAVTAKRDGRLLVGFSKSGWGAWTLLLRHPDKFQKAAAWDAPLMKAAPDQFGMRPIFGTQENFEQFAVSQLLKQHAKLLGKQQRLVLTGYGSFRKQHQQIRQLMEEQKIRCEYRDGPQRKHHWNSGWLEEAVELLIDRRQ